MQIVTSFSIRSELNFAFLNNAIVLRKQRPTNSFQCLAQSWDATEWQIPSSMTLPPVGTCLKTQFDKMLK